MIAPDDIGEIRQTIRFVCDELDKAGVSGAMGAIAIGEILKLFCHLKGTTPLEFSNLCLNLFEDYKKGIHEEI